MPLSHSTTSWSLQCFCPTRIFWFKTTCIRQAYHQIQWSLWAVNKEFLEFHMSFLNLTKLVNVFVCLRLEGPYTMDYWLWCSAYQQIDSAYKNHCLGFLQEWSLSHEHNHQILTDTCINKYISHVLHTNNFPSFTNWLLKHRALSVLGSIHWGVSSAIITARQI